MTYCLAITVNSGLVFASDSRTIAGPDQVRTYGKMHRFGVAGERQLVILSAGNLATSQAVIARVQRDIDEAAPENLLKMRDMEAAAEYLGLLSRAEEEKHGAAVAKAGLSAEATFIIGGQIGAKPSQLFLVYPQGNFTTTSEHTPFLQLGEDHPFLVATRRCWTEELVEAFRQLPRIPWNAAPATTSTS